MGLTTAEPAAAQAPAAPPVEVAGPAGARVTAPYSVTLITGDVVRVSPIPGGKYAITVRRGKGREKVPVITLGTKTGLTVTPADALPLVSAGRLDARLFDVLLLGRLGYDDRRRQDLPLLVTGQAGSAPATLTATSSVRTLPRLGVNVLREPKSQASAFWASYTAKSRARSLAPGKVWLVGARTPSLDVSVPQVGAPVAWNAGHTGAGVTVAVLDTGYDHAHPDLQGVVTAERDFTGSRDGTQDVEGHGTHVASTIAGRGTASGGRYTGVAKGAQLAVGKVCDHQFCFDDAILAGMEWAATSGAKVVNMSLGGPVAENGDPIEDAVNRLTTTGLLFVVSAGNAGPGPESVASPGTAEAALTVGAVTKSDQLSDFSSRGPRVNQSRRSDYAIKPDITAPGQDIVAARAAGTQPDLPASVQYVSASGTSMAAPHVAGGAAILAGQHPDWTPGQLKAALMASAKPNAALTVYQQGTGRLDLGRAVTETVLPSAGSLSLGYFPWPNSDAPTVRKTLTYTNTGQAAVTLNLGLTVVDGAGKPAPDGMFTASPSSLTVPAGATATVTVTVNPTAGPVGLYSGALTATTADGRTTVRTAVGAYQEPERHDLSIVAINRAGQPAEDAVAIAINQRTGDVFRAYHFEGTFVRRLPPGDYTVLGMVIEDSDPENPMGDRPLTLSARTIRLGQVNEVVLDARKGRQLKVSVPDQDAVAPRGYISTLVHDLAPDIYVGTDAGNTYLEPTTTRIPGLEFAVRTMLTKAGTGSSPEQPPSPYLYNIAQVVNDQLPADPHFRSSARDLARVNKVVARQGPTDLWAMNGFALTPKFPVSLGFDAPYVNLGRRVDYYSARDGVTFVSNFELVNVIDGQWHLSGYSASERRSHRPGHTGTEAWNTAPLGPAFRAGVSSLPQRSGDTLAAAVPMLTDSQAGHAGFGGWADAGTTTLRRDGKVITTSPAAGSLPPTEVPPGDGGYELETTLTRADTSPALSQRVHALWSFRSAHVPGATPSILPLNVIRHSPALDADNRAPAAGSFRIPVRFESVPGAPPAALKQLAVQVSYDGGSTWTPALLTGVGNHRTATVQHPGKAGFASLRAVAVDTAGNKVEQTIINAYALA